MRKTLLLGIAIVMLLFNFSGCMGECANKSEGEEDNSLEKVLKSGVLVLGLDEGYPPMGFRNDAGEICGFDIDVAEEVCRRMGICLVTKSINWDTKEEELDNGIIDCIWNGMSVTPEREKTMALSEPYMKNELIFVVPGDSEAKANHDLVGKTVGIQAGSSVEDVIANNSYCQDMKVSPYEENLTLLKELRQGHMDAALIDSIVAYYFIFSSDEKYYVLPNSLSEEECAIGFRKNDLALRDRVQEIIHEMKADGSLGKISTKWFGADITIVR